MKLKKIERKLREEVERIDSKRNNSADGKHLNIGALDLEQAAGLVDRVIKARRRSAQCQASQSSSHR